MLAMKEMTRLVVDLLTVPLPGVRLKAPQEALADLVDRRPVALRGVVVGQRDASN